MDATAVDKWLTVVQQGRELFAHHVPAVSVGNVMMAGLVLVLTGLFFGGFGARFAKAILCAMLGGLGFVIGANIAVHYGHPYLIGGLLGFVVLVAIGYYGHRLWVGIAVSLVTSMLALTWYGHDAILTEYHDYVFNEPTVAGGESAFSIPDTQEQATNALEQMWNQVTGFYDHLSSSQPATSRKALGLLLLCLCGGFIFGACCTRWAAILTCAAMGTVILCAGLVTYAEHFAEAGWEQQIAVHPYITLGSVAACFLLSTMVQARMTKPQSPPSKPED